MVRRLRYSPAPRKAYVLVAVLIVVVVLSLAAYRFTDSMTSEFAVAQRTSESAQTKAFATSGIHYAMGMLSDPNAMSGTLNNNPYDNPSAFSAQTLGDTSGPRSGGRFSLISVGDTNNGTGESRYTTRYGVTDESAKININAFMKLDTTGKALYDALMKFPNMTEEIADAIVDYVDSDDTARPAGAESSYYQGLNPAYRAKNGPVNSVDELLLVRGVTPQLLF
ncbi:MAG: general secretion pathway protein GspK, partial [Fimbriiglobus sp.]